MRKRRRLCACLIAAVLSFGNPLAANGSATADCDHVPSGVETSDDALDFRVPPGLMPDPQFDGLPATLAVHRVQPVFPNGRCPGETTRAAVLIHGRTLTGPVVFDLQHPAPEGGTLSMQEALARKGIDTFAPSLLGYGHSTRFTAGLDDPANASLRSYAADGTCPYREGCDRTHNPVFPLDQQGTLLNANPLGGTRREHSSNFRFARTDVWVRDIRQVIDDAIARAGPTGGTVTLIGYSLGALMLGGRCPRQAGPRSTASCSCRRSSVDRPRKRHRRRASPPSRSPSTPSERGDS